MLLIIDCVILNNLLTMSILPLRNLENGNGGLCNWWFYINILLDQAYKALHGSLTSQCCCSVTQLSVESLQLLGL